jgi:hypothetical protein
MRVPLRGIPQRTPLAAKLQLGKKRGTNKHKWDQLSDLPQGKALKGSPLIGPN